MGIGRPVRKLLPKSRGEEVVAGTEVAVMEVKTSKRM